LRRNTLVDTSKWWDGLALVLVQGSVSDLAVGKLDLTGLLVLPRESVLHPVNIITVLEVLTGMSTSRFLTSGSSINGLGSAGQQVLKLKGFNEISVPDHTTVSDLDILE
jgi:hypothetical protein